MKKLCLLLVSLIAASVILCACSGGAGGAGGHTPQSTKSLAEVFKTIRDKVDIKDFNEFNSGDSLDLFYGITAKQMDDYAGGINSTGTNQEEIVLIKAKDSAAAKEIRQALEKRYESKQAQNKNYNPKQAAMVEQCKPEQFDLYVTMIVSPHAAEITDIFKSELNLG